MDDTVTAEEKTERPAVNAKKVKRIAAKIAQNDDQALARKRRGKLAISILREIADGKAANPQALARAFFKGTKDARKEAKLAKDGATASE